jgi:hypothetical protein
MRTLENRARAKREIELTGIAAAEAGFALGESIPRVAGWTDRAIRPESIFQICACGVLVGISSQSWKVPIGERDI